MPNLLKGVMDGGPILVAIVFMFMMWMKDKRHKVSNDELLKCLKGIGSTVGETKELSIWLKDAHNQKDQDGVYVWYVRKSLEDSVNKLADSIQSLTGFMHDMHLQSKQTVKILEKLIQKIDDK